VTNDELIQVVTEVIEILEECGYDDRASWLSIRAEVLRDEATSGDAYQKVVHELHGVVLGMGGLMDLSLRPRPGSGYTSDSARARLDLLGDRMYVLTRGSN
jgi:hypothetical protein